MDPSVLKHSKTLEDIICKIGKGVHQTAQGSHEFSKSVFEGLATIVQLHDAHVRAKKDTSCRVEELAAMKAKYEDGLLSLQNKR